MKDFFKKILKNIKSFLPFIFFLLIYVLICKLIHVVSCPVKLITGFPCPGCGITRACESLLTFRLVRAFKFNPCVYLLPIIIVVLVFKDFKYISKLYHSNIFWIVIILIVIIVYILRLIYIYPEYPMNYYSKNIIKKLLDLF